MEFLIVQFFVLLLWCSGEIMETIDGLLYLLVTAHFWAKFYR